MSPILYIYSCIVALHPEGVDRNYPTPPPMKDDATSPSTRRAWIEIKAHPTKPAAAFDVALHPEGVDRKGKEQRKRLYDFLSPSTRRAWIEILP